LARVSTITVNPTDSKNLIAGQNDSRVGFNHCGVDWSRDGGATWGDQIPPFFQYVQADGHTADACSDPTEAFDSQGNAYAGGIIFDLASAANSVVVMKSNAGIDGEFFEEGDRVEEIAASPQEQPLPKVGVGCGQEAAGERSDLHAINGLKPHLGGEAVFEESSDKAGELGVSEQLLGPNGRDEEHPGSGRVADKIVKTLP